MAVNLNQSGAPSITARDPTIGGTNRWYALFLFVLAHAVNFLDKTIISVLVTPLKAEFGLSDVQVSLLSGLALTLPYAIFCIPMGMLADRFNRKWLLILVLTCWSIATMGAGLAATVTAIFMARIIVGAFEAGLPPMALSLIGDLFPRRIRSTGFGIYALGGPLGVLLAMVVGAAVAANYGWRTAFFVAGIPGVILAIVMAFSLREPVRVADDGKVAIEKAPPLLEIFRCILANRPLFNVLVGMVLTASMMAAMAYWLPTFFLRVHAQDAKTAGLMSAVIVGCCGAVGGTVGGLAADRLAKSDTRRLLMFSVTTLTAGACLLCGVLLAPNAATASIFLGISAFSAQAIFGPGYGLVVTLSPPSMRATTLSVLALFYNIVSTGILGSFIVGLVSDQMAAVAGARSIAFGMAATSAASVWAVFHLLRAYSQLRRTEH